jgi:hypothetical protein
MGARVVAMKILPQCNFCQEVAHYDFRMKNGHWAYACELHWIQYRPIIGGLGIGNGQVLISYKELRDLYKPLINNDYGE